MPDQPESREIVGLGVAQFLRVVARRWRLATPIALGGTLIALAAALLTPNVYESQVVLLPERPSSGRSGMLAGAAQLIPGLDLLGLGGGGDQSLLVSVLESRTVTDAVIRRFDLQRVYRTPTIEQTRRRLRKAVSVTTDRKAPTVTVTVEDRDPGRARDMAAMYAEEANRIANDINSTRARMERQFLEGRVTQVKGDLDKADAALRGFEAQHGLVDDREQARATIQAASHLRQELSAHEVQLSYARSYASGDDENVSRLGQEASSLRRQLAALEATDTAPGHTAREAKDRQNVVKSAATLPGLRLSWVRLQRELKTQEALFELLTRNYEVAKVNEVRDTSDAYLVDKPVVATEKTFPRYPQFVVVGLVLSLGLALLVVHWRERQQIRRRDRKHAKVLPVHFGTGQS